MRITKRAALLGAALALVTTSVTAAPVFDFDNGPITGSVGSLNTTDATAALITFTSGADTVDVTAGLSTSNLCCGNNFSSGGPNDIINSADVKWDNRPPGFGGLGVISKDNNDNIEGSKGNTREDEILFFDFGVGIVLHNVLLNGDHMDVVLDDLPDGTPTERWGLWTSLDGTDWTAYIGPSNQTDGDGNLVATGQEKLFLDGITSRYLAVSAVGPRDQVGGYIEGINIDVPEPASLTLLGLGLLGLGLRRRFVH